MSRNHTKGSSARNAFALTSLSVALLGAGVCTTTWAAPSGGTIVSGISGINTVGSVTTITQDQLKGIINWNNFSIGSGETVNFNQLMGSNSVVLNRVTGADASSIMGTLTANGRVFIVNPNGIVFGAGSSVDVAGLLATTLSISDSSFNSGSLAFSGLASAGKIQNLGHITVGDNGFLYLVAPSVDNAGVITANLATVTLAAGNQFTVNLQGGDLVNFAVSADALTAAGTDTTKFGLTNSGAIDAQHVVMSASQASGLMSSVVNNTGVIEASTLDMKGAGIVQAGSVAVTDTASLTATDTIATAIGSSTRAHTLNLAVTADGASVGAEGSALLVDADVLNAHAANGNVIVTDTAGGVALGEISTGTSDNVNQRRALITSQGGDITSADPARTNVAAWSTNLVAAGSIGTSAQSVTTDVDVLSASTSNGNIYIRDLGDQVVLGAIKAGELINVNGQFVSSTAMSGSDGSVTLANGAAGTKNVSIRAQGDLFLSDAVSAGNAVTLTSETGNIYTAADAATLTAKTVNLNAARSVGLDGGAIKLQTETLNAAAGNGGVHASESNGLTVGTVTAAGTGNDVSIDVSQGNLKLGSVVAAGGNVSLTTGNGTITDNNGAAANVQAASLSIASSAAVGTANKSIDTSVDAIDATVSGALAGLYLSNDKALASLAAAVINGDVRVGYLGGQLAFTRASSQLSLTGSNAMDVDFSNRGGDILVAGGMTVGNLNTIALSSSGSITQTGSGTLVARSVDLDAGKDVGSANVAVRTTTSTLTANSDAGIINVSDNSSGALTVDATANGKAGSVAVSHTGGDLLVDSVATAGNASLTASGNIRSASGDGASSVTATGLQLSGASVGSDSSAFLTQVAGAVSINAAAGALNYANIGAVTLLDATAAGAITLNNSGDVGVGKVQAGGAIRFTTDSAATDANGAAANFIGTSLDASAASLGTSTDALESQVGSLTAATTGGGIYLANTGGQALALVSATSGGTNGDIDISNEGDIGLGVVNAGGANVSLTSSAGAIEDTRPAGTTAANVSARNLTMNAAQGIGETRDLSLDVTQLSAAGGGGGVKATNAGAIAVDAGSLEHRGPSGVSITATDITILDNNGGVITMDPGGNLVLTATTGSIVFLNQDDTIYLPGGGSIILTALGKSDLLGYNGAIIVGNLRTDGGAIRLEAQANITIGMLDATSAGDVSVIARNGVILDGNGTAENIRGNHVVLESHLPSQRDAQLAEETAISDYAAKLAELNAKTFDLQVLIQQLQSYETLVQNATLQQQLAATTQRLAALAVAAKSAQVDSAQSTLDTLNTALKVATLVRNAAAFIAGAAQAIPFSGDAGADAAFAAVDVAMAVADLALDSYERYTFNPLAGQLDDLNNQFDQAQAALTTAITNLRTTTVIRDTVKTSEQMAELAVFKATVAYDASTQLRKQAVAAYDLGKDIDTSADKPLGISANKLDITGSGADGALNSSLYLNTAGSLGLGDISVVSGEQIVAQAGQNIGVVGTVSSDTAISLNAGAAILGQGGTLVTPALTAIAGSGIGMNQAVNTRVSTLAAAGGTGGVNLSNRTGELLTISAQGAVQGVSGAGDVTVDTDGDLKISQLVKDSSGTHTVTLNSTGDIIDGNGTGRNVQGGELVVNAGKSVDLDTEVEGLSANLTGTGNLNLRDASNLAAHHVSVNDGDIDIDAQGNLIVGRLNASTVHGTITLTANGRIDDDQDNTTSITGNHLAMTAGGGIGANGDMLTTNVNLLDGTAGDAIQIANAGDVTVGNLSTTRGDVFLASRTGSITLGIIATRTGGSDANTITLAAHDSIVNGLGDATVANLTAANLSLKAGAGIGAGNTLNVQASRLEATGGTGGIDLANLDGDLAIGAVTPSGDAVALNGLNVDDGGIKIDVKQGTLTAEREITASGTGDVSLQASGDVTLQATLTANASAVSVVSGGALTQDAIVSGNTGVSLSAANDVAQNAGITAADGNVAVASAGGSVTMADGTSTAIAGSGDVSYSAAGDVRIGTLSTADGTATLTATAGGVRGNDGVAVHVTAHDLTANAATGIGGLSGGPLYTSVDTLTANATQAGSVYVWNMGDVHLNQVTSANGDVQVSAMGDIVADDVQAKAGTASLYADGNLATSPAGLVQAQFLDASASGEVNVHTRADRMSIRAGQGDIAVREDGDTTLTSIRTDEGDIAITAAGNVAVRSVNAAGGDGNVTLAAGGAVTDVSNVSPLVKALLRAPAPIRSAIVADNLDLSAGTGIGTGDSGTLTVDVNSVSASTGTGNANLTRTGNVHTGTLSVDKLVASQGDVNLSVDNGDVTVGNVQASGHANLTAGNGSLQDDGDASTRIVAGASTLNASGGIGVQTRVDTLSATAGGDVNVDEADGLASLSVQTPGNVSVSTATGDIVANDVNGNVVSLDAANGAIGDTGSGTPSVTANQLALNAGRGVGSAGNALDISTGTLSANGGTGGIYGNNLSSGSLTLADGGNGNALTAAGDVFLTTRGALIVAGTVSSSNNGNIALQSGGNLSQNAGVSTGGDVSIVAGGDVDMGAGSSTTSGGNVSYQANGQLALTRISAGNGSTTGSVTLTAPAIVDNLPGQTNISAAVVDLDARAASAELIRNLIGNSTDAASVSLGARPYAGAFTETQRFMNELPKPAAVRFDGGPAVDVKPVGVWVPARDLVTDAR